MNTLLNNPLPEWHVSQWFNTTRPLHLSDLRGQVVVVHAFQMLCPGCVMEAIPQANRIHDLFADKGVAVIGLHTVFEHHEAMQPHALEAFLHEFRVEHPVGVDASSDAGPIPQTMAELGLAGTPSLILLDRSGRVRMHRFGKVDELWIGAMIGNLLAEPAETADTAAEGDA